MHSCGDHDGRPGRERVRLPLPLNAVLENDLVFPRSLAPDARDLIQLLLQPDPSKRLATASAVRSHAFFRPIDWDIVRRQVRMTRAGRLETERVLACPCVWAGK